MAQGLTSIQTKRFRTTVTLRTKMSAAGSRASDEPHFNTTLFDKEQRLLEAQSRLTLTFQGKINQQRPVSVVHYPGRSYRQLKRLTNCRDETTTSIHRVNQRQKQDPLHTDHPPPFTETNDQNGAQSLKIAYSTYAYARTDHPTRGAVIGRHRI